MTYRFRVLTIAAGDDLTDVRYDLPLTLKTRVPPDWAAADVRQGKRTQRCLW